MNQITITQYANHDSNYNSRRTVSSSKEKEYWSFACDTIDYKLFKVYNNVQEILDIQSNNQCEIVRLYRSYNHK